MTRPTTALLLTGLALAALVGARPHAGGWNDGSRLAAVESLAERGTLVIDESIFVRVPAEPPQPYPADRPDLLAGGTKDKLLIGGRFYSDKTPAPSALLAGLYRAWMALGGPRAAERPDLFCRWLAVVSAGLPLALAAWGVVRLGREVGLEGRAHALYSLSFVAATVAPAYSRQVNGHEPFLAAAAWLCASLARAQRLGRFSPGAALGAGALAGVGYTLDLGVGTALVLALVPFVGIVFKSWRTLGWLALGAAPWLLAHHWLNYEIGGTFGPANAVPEYLAWPGSPFDARTATGGLQHSPLGLVLYTGDLLFGKKGFVTHNPPLMLALAGLVRLAAKSKPDRPALAFVGGWWLLAVGAYAATSTNLSGECPSVRWFVPLLAPGYWALGLTLKRYPWLTLDLAWLTLIGIGPMLLMWQGGPWMRTLVPGWWTWALAALVGWAAVGWRQRRAVAAD